MVKMCIFQERCEFKGESIDKGLWKCTFSEPCNQNAQPHIVKEQSTGKLITMWLRHSDLGLLKFTNNRIEITED